MSSPPTTLGKYQIIREIARSNDIVYEAYDPEMNRRLAIKELAMPSGATSQQQDERTNRFRREAQAAGTLNHPNIMTVFAFGEDGGRTFMAMEFLDGCSLRNELDTKGVLPQTRAIEIAIEVLRGLEHAHAKGVIHRDIKPDNIQLLTNGGIKITDFGIARLTFQPNLTMDGQVFGTPSYMSPEQVVGKEIDARSDLFSLGVMLYEMVSGQKPFAGDSVVSITYAIMNKEPQQPAGVDWPLWSVIAKALEKTPSMRYASAADMIQALEKVLHPVSPLADPATANSYGAANPYGGGMAIPPVVPPAYGGSPVLSQPYNPYTQAAPMANPTMAPGQPGVYAQPYAPGGQGAYVNPYQPQAYGAPQPLPVYYPPPPRAPWFKPDQVLFMKRLGVAMILGISMVLLVIVLLNAVATWQDDETKQNSDQRIDPKYVNIDPNASLQQNIDNLEIGLDKARGDETRAAIGSKLGKLHTEEAQLYTGRGDLSHAEAAYQKAEEEDSTNPEAAAEYGRLLYTKGNSETDLVEKQRLFKSAAENLAKAAQSETDTSRANADNHDAALANYEYAVTTKSIDPNARGDIRNALITAQDQVVNDQSLANSIQGLIAEYR